MGQAFGIIGLEVMGRNIALNIERNGFPHRRLQPHVHEDGTLPQRHRQRERTPRVARRLPSSCRCSIGRAAFSSWSRPGRQVDAVIAELKPHLQEGDIVIDGGNSLFTDTQRRTKELEGTGIKFFGMGVSGGEEGALWGPSLMPGGDTEAYQHLKPILTKIAAKAPDDGYPCADHMGKGGAGHFVKMVHNGIEYGDMQLIAEAYSLLKHVGGLDNAKLKDVFEDWNRGDDLKSFLIEITAKVINFQDDSTNGKPLVELILDKAGAKGHGQVDEPDGARPGRRDPDDHGRGRRSLDLGGQRTARSGIEGAGRAEVGEVGREVVDRRCPLGPVLLEDLFLRAGLRHARGGRQGVRLRAEHGRHCPRVEGRCIIRAVFLNDITKSFNEQADLPNLLLAPRFRDAVSKRQEAWRRVVSLGIAQGIPLPAFSASSRTTTATAASGCPRISSRPSATSLAPTPTSAPTSPACSTPSGAPPNPHTKPRAMRRWGRRRS
jgi:6-phosphogluconate dehydrogenase